MSSVPQVTSGNPNSTVLSTASNTGVMENRVVVPLNVQSPQRGPAQSNDPSNVAQAVSSAVAHSHGDGTYRINLPPPNFHTVNAASGPNVEGRLCIAIIMIIVGIALVIVGSEINNSRLEISGWVLMGVGAGGGVGTICFSTCEECPPDDD